MNITILDAKTLGKDIDLSFFSKYGKLATFDTTSSSQTIERIKDSDIVITNKVIIDKTVMDACKKLKLICIAATGMNNVDLNYAKEKNIKVTNVAGYSTKSVTQHTFAMLFYLLEKLKYYDNFVKEKNWQKNKIFTNIDKPFFEISGKRWGIIAMGEIGSEVAKVATAFGSEVVYYSTSGQNDTQPYTRLSLQQLLQTSQIISIHAPLNENTHNLIAKKELQLMQENAILLNLGRGNIVEENDLANVLEDKKIYVGLDVTSVEPLLDDSPLLRLKDNDNLLITPHIAWTSHEARDALVKGIEKNIKDFLRDHTL